MAQHDTEPTWTQWQDEAGNNRGMMAGTLLASAVAAGVVAYLVRRGRQEEPRHVPPGLAGKAYERTRDVMGEERLEAGREFLMNRVVPEFKPAMLAILEDVEQVVDTAFRRAEKAIKSL